MPVQNPFNLTFNGNITQWDSTNLGAPSNYGTSPGAVTVIGVNAFVTNTVAVTLTSTTITGTVTVVGDAANGSAVAGNPVLIAGSDGTDARTLFVNSSGYAGVIVETALPNGSNTIGAVTQASGPWTVTQTPATSGGLSTNVQQALTTSAQVKSTAGQLYGYKIGNTNASTVCYVFFYNTTSAPTIGSTTNLIDQLMIPGGSAAVWSDSNGIAFSSGIYVAVSTSATGSSAPGTGLVITSLYK